MGRAACLIPERMEQNRQRLGLVNLLVLLVGGAVGLALGREAGSLAAPVAMVFIFMGFLVTLVSWFQMGLEARERLEQMEFDELSRGQGASGLFTKDAETFPARRSREQFERVLIPLFTTLLFLGQAAACVLLWRHLAQAQIVELSDAQTAQLKLALPLFGLFGVVLFLIGLYTANVARLEKVRLLRPSASYLLLGSGLCVALASILLLSEAGFLKTDDLKASPVDLISAKVLCALLGVMAVETLVALVLEGYRPRVKGKQARLLYDSRMVGFLGQPESVFKAAAHALDYQFGFKVSETWFYRFLEGAAAWVILAQFGALLASTCVVLINPGEQALLERFGRPVEGRDVLGPGLHFKLPWPVDAVHRYDTDRIQSFIIGVVQDEEEQHEKVELWTKGHAKEEYNLLVPSRETNAARASETGNIPPVNLLTINLPVHYQITNLTDWAYRNSEPGKLLETLTERELTRYLVSVDLNDIMLQGRETAAEAIRERLEKSAQASQLGVRILFTGLQNIHPPVTVGADFEKVVSATQTREATILTARAEALQTNAMSRSESYRKLRLAEAEKERLEVSARARSASFTNQIPAYQAAPAVYSTRAYLKVLQEASVAARKYVLAATNTQDVIQLNLEDKFTTDLLRIPTTVEKVVKKADH